MKRIGLLGGMSWESSVEYERIINEEVRRRLGGASSADLLIRSYNFAEIESLQESGRWDLAGRRLADDARWLVDGGAELLLLCTNTMHTVASAIEDAVAVPLLHIADVTADAIAASGLDHVALLGTRYTMEQPFYRDRIARRGIRVDIPDAAGRTTIHDIIFDELVRGIVDPGSRAKALTLVDRLVSDGAQGVIAGCTEIELLITPNDVEVPYFPTTRLHAIAAVDIALS